MPPTKKKQTAATRGKQQSGSSGSPDSPKQTKRRCDGCTETISATTDALKCSICHVWLHRYCAGIPSSRFAAVASSFICSACSISASASIVAELRSEIAALKEEVSELRAALRSSEQNLEKKLSLQAEALATSQNSSNYTNGGRPLDEVQRRRRRPSRQPRSSRANRPVSELASAVTNHRKPCVPVQGKRKLWGTRRITSVSDITTTIYAHTSIKSGLAVKS